MTGAASRSFLRPRFRTSSRSPMHPPLVMIKPPVIQLAIDLFTVDEALRLAEVGVKAGVDWLEAGTPLIVRRGADAIGAIARAFPQFPVLADYKTMDSG